MKLLLSAVALVLSMNAASAATVIDYTAVGSGGSPSLGATTAAPGVTAGQMSAGAGLGSAGASGWNWDGWTATGAADALSQGQVWSWGFSSAQAWDLTSFSIRLGRNGNGPQDFLIEMAVNGASSFATVLTGSSIATNGTSFLNIDLSSFDAITSASFRLIAWGARKQKGSLGLANDATLGRGFVLDGELSPPPAPIPLPAGLPLMLAGLGALALVRRRRS